MLFLKSKAEENRNGERRSQCNRWPVLRQTGRERACLHPPGADVLDEGLLRAAQLLLRLIHSCSAD